jgi:uncharacterized protein YjiS (DUF1127 family)
MPAHYPPYCSADIPRWPLLHATAAAVMEALRRQAQCHARRRAAHRTEQELGWFDDRTLRDLGLGRSEIGSIASESAGDVEATRQRITRMYR